MVDVPPLLVLHFPAIGALLGAFLGVFVPGSAGQLTGTPVGFVLGAATGAILGLFGIVAFGRFKAWVFRGTAVE